MIEPQYDASIDFLQRWCPGGPWVLSAVTLDKKQMDTQTFRDPAEVLEFLKKYGVDRNCYFSVNSCRYDMQKKLTREDIKSLDWLHVDIDPRAGEDLNTERQRARKLLLNPPQGIVKPTVIVFSGGGYQAYWKLAEPLPINGEEALFEDAKRYNQALELAFGADNCHNVDRIMRLPGTINRPDERKQKKGRTEALAEVFDWNDSRIYPLSQFKQAPAVQTKGMSFGVSDIAKVSGNIPRINNVNDLVGISDLCKMVISEGTDPDDPTRFPSRSEALWFVVCELVRADIDNDLIFSVITDPDFKISESVLDKGRSADKYAKKQIRDAHDAAIAPELRQMNNSYAVILKPKTRVMSWVPDEIDPNRKQIICQSFEDIRNSFCNEKVQIGTDAQNNPRYAPLGDWWLKQKKRCQYEGIVFRPNGDIPGYYNLWQGFGIEPKPGDWSPMEKHITEVLASGTGEWADYIGKWCAWAVQNPDKRAEVALVLRGEEGTGKGVFGRAMCALFGQHAMHIGSSGLLTGRFTGHLRDCVLLFADEAVAPGDQDAAGKLKKFITEPTLDIEGKNEQARQVPNYLHIVMSSNHEWVANASPSERRYAIFDVPSTHKGDKPYWEALHDWLKNGGVGAWLHHLLNMDLGNWHPRWNIPQTPALARQKEYSLPGPIKYVYEALCDGGIPVHRVEGQCVFVAAQRWHDKLVKDARVTFSRRALTNQLKRIATRQDTGVGTTENSQDRADGWWLLPLPEARQEFREVYPGLPPFPEEPSRWPGVKEPETPF